MWCSQCGNNFPDDCTCPDRDERYRKIVDRKNAPPKPLPLTAEEVLDPLRCFEPLTDEMLDHPSYSAAAKIITNMMRHIISEVILSDFRLSETEGTEAIFKHSRESMEQVVAHSMRIWKSVHPTQQMDEDFVGRVICSVTEEIHLSAALGDDVFRDLLEGWGV